jgi:hypothetical protein
MYFPNDLHISDATLVVPPLAYGKAHASFSFRLVFASVLAFLFHVELSSTFT